MNYQEAYEAILAILDQVDDASLPKGKVEHRSDSTVIWFGGTGRHLGSARRNGVPDPTVYHAVAARTALELEAVYRADLAYSKGER